MKQWIETREVLERLETLVRAGRRAALVTVVRVRGSAYRREGAKLLVADDGSTIGNVSGGCLEADAREVGLEVLRSGVAQLRTYCSGAGEDPVFGLGLGCEGEVELFVEPATATRLRERALLEDRKPFVACSVMAGPTEAIGKRLIVTSETSEGSLGSRAIDARVAQRARELLGASSTLEEFGDRTVFLESLVPPPHLVLCGGGEDARPLARFATDVGFKVTVVDHRPAMLGQGRFSAGVACVESDGDALLAQVTLDENTYAVVMTHNFGHDLAYVQQLLTTPAAYIGILGSRERAERLVASTPSDRVFSPVGLDLGADGAEQIAIAIISEILAVRSGRRPRFLRERVHPIHAFIDA